MRRLVPLLVFVAACTSPAEDTTTTGPLAQPSTTAPTTPSTTTTATEPTTTAGGDCEDRDGDGVLRVRRGFICPPHLRVFESRSELPFAPTVEIHLPGRYTTRLTEPAFSFTRSDRFSSFGEGTEYVQLDEDGDWVGAGPSGRAVLAFPGNEIVADLPEAQPINRPEGFQWVVDLTTSETDVGGYPATVSIFDVSCPDANQIQPQEICHFGQIASATDWAQLDGQRTGLVVVDHPSGPFVIVAEALSPSLFDTYWIDVVEPILDSIEFLDQ